MNFKLKFRKVKLTQPKRPPNLLQMCWLLEIYAVLLRSVPFIRGSVGGGRCCKVDVGVVVAARIAVNGGLKMVVREIG